jgi:Tol biopolymer transport system component
MGFLRTHRGGVCFVLGTTLCLSTHVAHAIEFRQLTFLTPDYDNGVGTPDWSPDGSQLAATSWNVDSDYPYELHQLVYFVDVSSGSWIEFPSNRSWYHPLNSEPSWSPAGDRIVFTAESARLWLGDVAQSVLTPLVNDGTDPAWSPDGAWIAYVAQGAIWIIPAAGGTPTPLTGGRSPAWSRDGNWIAYSSPHNGTWDVWIVPSHGGDARRITDGAGNDFHPTWSPDGDLIAFASDRSGNLDLWAVRVSSGSVSQITNHPGADSDPAWSPDGSQIAFTSDRSGVANIWVASDLRTVSVEPTTWSGLKQMYR